MKVLLVTSQPVAPPWNSGDKNLARALIVGDTGAEMTFVGDRDDPSPWPARHRRISLAFLDDVPTTREKLRIAGALLRRRPRVDLVHVMVTFMPGAWTQRAVLALPSMRSARLVLTCPTGAFLPRTLIRRAAAVCVLTERTRRQIADSGNRRVHLIRPGIDLARFSPEPRQEALAALGLPDAPALLFAGHYDPGGGLEEALAVEHHLKARLPDLQLLLAMRRRPDQNPARLSAWLREQVLGRGLGGSVKLMGGRANMRLALQAASAVLFQPAVMGLKMELPMTLLEALATGRPIVTTVLEPLDELGDGSPAVVAGGHDSPQVLTHLERLCSDGAYNAACAVQARSLAEARYDQTRMVDSYRRLYAELMAVPRSAEGVIDTD